MLDHEAPVESTVRPRDRLPTVPHDLSELARLATGPASGTCDVDRLFARLIDVADCSLAAKTCELLADVSPVDVPRVAMSTERAVSLVDHRHAYVLACVDGASSLGDLVEIVRLPTGDVLEIVCHLCARGILVLDRTCRAA
jgi:hypothetical protein